jgi:hypothetical protein
MADITAMTIATFAIRLNIVVLTQAGSIKGIYHLLRLTALAAETASQLGTCCVSRLIRTATANKKATTETHSCRGLLRRSLQ